MSKLQSRRLSQNDWLDHGLKILAKSGAGALKAVPLAKSLNVSRGSFYWHFKDIGQFHDTLLAKWRAQMTEAVITSIEAESGGTRLALMLRSAVTANDQLERGVRSWATANKKAASAVAAVDLKRLAYLEKLLRAAGVPPRDARARAVFAYWAYIGRIMMGQGIWSLADRDFDAIADLFQSGDRQP